MLPIDGSLVREKSLNKKRTLFLFFFQNLYPPKSASQTNIEYSTLQVVKQKENHTAITKMDQVRTKTGTVPYRAVSEQGYTLRIGRIHIAYIDLSYLPPLGIILPRVFFRCFEWFPTIKDIYTDKPVEDRRMMQLLSRIRSMISVLPIPKGGAKQEPKSSLQKHKGITSRLMYNKNLAYPCWFMKIMGATSPPFNEINPSTGGTKGPSTMDQPIGPWHDLQVLQFQRSRGPRKAVDPMCHPYTWMPIWDLLVRDLRDLVMTQST